MKTLPILPNEIILAVLDQSQFSAIELLELTTSPHPPKDLIATHLSRDKFWRWLSPDAAIKNVENQSLRAAFIDRFQQRSTEAQDAFICLRDAADGVYESGMFFPAFSPKVLNNLGDFDVMLAACQLNPDLYQTITEPLNDEPLIALASFENGGGKYLGRASRRLRDMEIVVDVAVAGFGISLQHASDRLRDREETALLACKNNAMALEDASPRLQKDVSFVRKVFESKPSLGLFSALDPAMQSRPDVIDMFKDVFFETVFALCLNRDTNHVISLWLLIPEPVVQLFMDAL